MRSNAPAELPITLLRSPFPHFSLSFVQPLGYFTPWTATVEYKNPLLEPQNEHLATWKTHHHFVFV